MSKKIIAVFLCLALMSSAFSGCGLADLFRGSGSKVNPEAAVSGKHFDSVWRGDVDFNDMEYVHYDLDWFSEYTDPIYGLAENGGSSSDFKNADYDLLDELYYVHTMYILADLKYTEDPSDDEAAQEYLYMDETFYGANSQYWEAMHAMAVSEYSSLMEVGYAGWQISYFADYEPSGSWDEDTGAQSRLIQEYYSLIAQEEVDYDRVAQVFVELVNCRRQQAADLGYDSYADYAYENIYAKNYTPEDAQSIWYAAKNCFAPIIAEYGEAISSKALDVHLSGSVDCSPDSIYAAMESVLPRISGELYDAYKYMREYNLCNIEPSAKKSNTGFTARLYYYNEPYVMNNPSGTYFDYSDTFHEFGHFVNSFYTVGDLIFGIDDNDLSELQSQGMEIMFLNFYDDIFGAENGEALRSGILMNILYSVVDGAMYDEFLQRVYSEDGLTAQRAAEIFDEVYFSYGCTEYEGYEHEWMDVSHNFEYPFYYISYAVSAIPALELYVMSLDSFESAAQAYVDVAAMDCEYYYFDEALQEAGLSDVFDIESCRRIARGVAGSLDPDFRSFTPELLPGAGGRQEAA